MNCPNCGTQNSEGAKFCIGCGSPLEQTQTNNQNMNQMAQTTMPNQNQNMQTTMPNQNQQPIYNNTGMYNNGRITGYIQGFNPFLFLVQAFLKPVKCFKEKASDIIEPKNSLVLGAIVTVLSVILSLISKILSTVHVSSIYSETSWNWEALNDFPWFKTIGKDFLLIAGIIFGVALIFYLAGLILKKDTNYLKMVSIASVAFIPTSLGLYLLGPILGMLWYQFEIIFPIIGICYSIVILSTLVNTEIQLEKDQKIYFNFICYAIIFVILYFVIYQMTIGSAINQINSSYSSMF